VIWVSVHVAPSKRWIGVPTAHTSLVAIAIALSVPRISVGLWLHASPSNRRINGWKWW
jgi:hypothetical protein